MALLVRWVVIGFHGSWLDGLLVRAESKFSNTLSISRQPELREPSLPGTKSGIL